MKNRGLGSSRPSRAWARTGWAPGLLALVFACLLVACSGGASGSSGGDGQMSTVPAGTQLGSDASTSGARQPGMDAGAPGSPSSGDATTGTPNNPGGMQPSNPAAWINANGAVSPGSNPYGIHGPWYAFGDGTTSTTASGNPYTQGKYCVTGTALGDGNSAHWGVGIGLDLNSNGSTKSAYAWQGKITGFRIRLEGMAPDGVRVHFVTNLSDGVSPFVTATLNQTEEYSIADARVPLDWNVTNAGEVVGPNLYSVQVEVPADVAGPINVCITDFAAVNDLATEGGASPTGSAYINSDGWITASNAFGITGQVYAISDGTSTTQTGNPYSSGSYCVAGTFTGATNAWGAGIAFDLNHPPGGSRAAYTVPANLAGFRIALSGTSPGGVHVAFVTNDPPSGDQPFLVGRIGTTQDYRVAWAQVPPDWSVSNAGASVGSTMYTVQVSLDGSKPGPFNVCVTDFEPLAASDLTETAAATTTGYTGFQTVNPQFMASEFTSWKAAHLKDCGDGTACVPRDGSDCISEGIGYGMLITTANDDQASFNKLWAYYQKNQNTDGVMNWQTNVCGSIMATGSATDGDLDVATALVQAGCRWGGSYKSEAVTLINAIRTHEVTQCGSQTILMPGDGFGGCSRTDPSYFATGYFKLFNKVAPNATWSSLVDGSYALLAKVQSATSGLSTNWTDSNASIFSGTDGTYGQDASRVPWRVATDFVWNNEPRAATFLNNMATYIDGNGGIPRLFSANSAFRGALAMSALPSTSAKAQTYTDAWLQTSSEQDDAVYYPGTLRLVYMLLMMQMFPNGC